MRLYFIIFMCFISFGFAEEKVSYQQFMQANQISPADVKAGRYGMPLIKFNGVFTPWSTLKRHLILDENGKILEASPIAPEELPSETAPDQELPPAEPHAQTLGETHQALFDFFFPPLSLNEEEEKAHQTLKQQTGAFILQSQDLSSLLFPLTYPAQVPHFPTDLAKEFPDFMSYGFSALNSEDQERLLMALRRDSNNDWRSYVWNLRKVYLSLAYPAPMANQLANVAIPSPQVKTVPFSLPESKLKLREGEITHEEGEIDYLVIGSGPAGSLIAHELARQGKQLRIVVLDAGSFVIPGSVKTESLSQLMESGNRRTNKVGSIAFRNGYTVGGGSTVNLDLAFPPWLDSIRDKISGWVTQTPELHAFFHSSDPQSANWSELNRAYDWVESKLRTRIVNPSEINANNAILMSLDPSLGEPATYKLNQMDFKGDPNEALKISAVDAFLLPALRGGEEFSSHLSLIPDAKTTRVLFDSETGDKKAIGVEIVFQSPLDETYILKDPNDFQTKAGDKATLHAKNVILSAGTLGSADILLRSHMENEEIGRGILIHPSIGLPTRFPYEMNPHEGLSTSVYAKMHDDNRGYFFESMSADPSFLALVHPGSGEQILNDLRQYRHFGGFGIMLIDSPAFDNRIALDETGSTIIHYSFSESDKERMRQGLKDALTTLFQAGALEIVIPSSEPLISSDLSYHPLTSLDQVEEAITRFQFSDNENVFSSAHMQGSNKLGNDPERSVVSPNFRVWNRPLKKEIPNLYVVDSSVFPTSVGANPMQSIYTVAKLFMDHILFPPSAPSIPSQEIPLALPETVIPLSPDELSSAPTEAVPPSETPPPTTETAPKPEATESLSPLENPQQEEAPTEVLPLQATSDFDYVFSNEQLRQKFSKFLSTIFYQLDEPAFFQLIDDIRTYQKTDSEIYAELYRRVGEAKKTLPQKAALDALHKLQNTTGEQVKNITDPESRVRGYLEIGSPGRYVRTLAPIISLSSPIYAMNSSPPSFLSRLEVGFPFTFPYDQFLPLNDYDPIRPEDIPDESVDLVSLFIGLHHIPTEKLVPFLQSIHRILRPGGTFLLRDHDANTEEMKKLVTVVHAVFNAATGETPEAEAVEFRNFTSLQHWIDAVEAVGFTLDTRVAPQIQEEDPTANALIKFTKNETEAQKELRKVQNALAKDPNYKRALLQTYLTAPEWHNVAVTQEYAKFIEHTPFYAFPYFSHIGLFWQVYSDSWNAARQENSWYDVMFSQYNLMNLFIGGTMTGEFFLKGLFSIIPSWLYQSEENSTQSETLQVLINDPENKATALDARVQVLESYPTNTLKRISVPRYFVFTEVMEKFAASDLEVVEIAGQQEVQLKVQVPVENEDPCQGVVGCKKLYVLPILTNPKQQYLALQVKVSHLGQVLRHLRPQVTELFIHDF